MTLERLVALLIADLMGSTEPLDGLTDNVGEERRRTHLSLVREAVANRLCDRAEGAGPLPASWSPACSAPRPASVSARRRG